MQQVAKVVKPTFEQFEKNLENLSKNVWNKIL